MTGPIQLNLFQKAGFEVSDRFTPDAVVTLFHGDRLELLEQIADSKAKAELIVTSPPYNLGKEYETSLEAYIERQRRTLEASLEILSPTGSICWQVGN